MNIRKLLSLFLLCASWGACANGFDKLVAIQKQVVPIISRHQIEGATGQAPEVPYACGLLEWEQGGTTYWNVRLHGIARSRNFVSEGINFGPLNAYDQYKDSGHSALGIAAQERVVIVMPVAGEAPLPQPPVGNASGGLFAEMLGAGGKLKKASSPGKPAAGDAPVPVAAPTLSLSQKVQAKLNELRAHVPQSPIDAKDIAILEKYLEFERVLLADIATRDLAEKTEEEELSQKRVTEFLTFLSKPPTETNPLLKFNAFRKSLAQELQNCITAINERPAREEEVLRLAIENAEKRKKAAAAVKAREEAEKAERLKRAAAAHGAVSPPLPHGVPVATSPSGAPGMGQPLPTPTLTGAAPQPAPSALTALLHSRLANKFKNTREGGPRDDMFSGVEEVAAAQTVQDTNSIESWAQKKVAEDDKAGIEQAIACYKRQFNQINIPEAIVNNKIAIALAISALKERLAQPIQPFAPKNLRDGVNANLVDLEERFNQFDESGNPTQVYVKKIVEVIVPPTSAAPTGDLLRRMQSGGGDDSDSDSDGWDSDISSKKKKKSKKKGPSAVAAPPPGGWKPHMGGTAVPAPPPTGWAAFPGAAHRPVAPPPPLVVAQPHPLTIALPPPPGVVAAAQAPLPDVDIDTWAEQEFQREKQDILDKIDSLNSVDVNALPLKQRVPKRQEITALLEPLKGQLAQYNNGFKKESIIGGIKKRYPRR